MEGAEPHKAEGESSVTTSETIAICLRAWKEICDAMRSLEPARLADGIDEAERAEMRTELAEARERIDDALAVLG